MFGLLDPLDTGFAYTFLFASLGGLLGGVLFGLTTGLVFGLVNIVVSVLGEGQDPHGSNPWELLATDRKVALARVMAIALIITFIGWLAGEAVSW